MLTLPPLLWAGNSVIGSLVVGRVPPLALNALRWTIAFAILLPLGWRAFARPGEIASRLVHLALLGLLGVGSYNSFQYVALHTSSPVNVTLIAASSSLFMLAVGMIGYRVHPERPQIVGALLSIAGVLFVLSRGSLHALAALRFVPGDLFMLAATLAWAIYSWMLVRPPAHMVAPARPPWNWAEFLAVQVAFGMVWSGLAAAAEHAIAPQAIRWSGWTAAALLYVAVGPALIAYYAWGAGVARVGPTVAALFSNLTPLFAALLSLALLGHAWSGGDAAYAFNDPRPPDATELLGEFVSGRLRP